MMKVHKPRVKSTTSKEFQDTLQAVKDFKLNTVCQEAACPNIGECWKKKHVTMMIMGDTCTRACAFCNVKTGLPGQLDKDEPRRIGESVLHFGAKHVVITSVDRDDLPDGGAQHFLECINEIRRQSPETTVEILTPDFRNKTLHGNKWNSIDTIMQNPPDVFNHNIETVPSLYITIRPGARYYHSLSLLEEVKNKNPNIFTKSGIMVGLGETKQEVLQVMDDFRSAGIDFMTIGQYLQPTKKHAEVKQYVPDETFDFYKRIAYSKGFLLVSSSPLTRSSYHADDDFAKLQEKRKSGGV